MKKLPINGMGQIGRIAMGNTIPLQSKEEISTSMISHLETADKIESAVEFTQIEGSLNPTEDVVKEVEARKQFNKVFGFLKNVDIPKQYIAIKCKQSNLSKSQRDRLLAYVTIRSNNDPKFKEMIDKLNELINKGLKVVRSNENSDIS